jgi:hypothetical protein
MPKAWYILKKSVLDVKRKSYFCNQNDNKLKGI